MITVSGLFYCGWVLSLFQSGNLERLGHLALTFAAQGTIIFRLLLISGPTLPAITRPPPPWKRAPYSLRTPHSGRALLPDAAAALWCGQAR